MKKIFIWYAYTHAMNLISYNLDLARHLSEFFILLNSKNNLFNIQNIIMEIEDDKQYSL